MNVVFFGEKALILRKKAESVMAVRKRSLLSTVTESATIAGRGFVSGSTGQESETCAYCLDTVRAALLHHRASQTFLCILQPAEIHDVCVAHVLHCLQRGLRAASGAAVQDDLR